MSSLDDGVIKWKHFPRYWPFLRGVQWSPVNSPHKAQWRGAMMFSLICVWINGWVNNHEAGNLKRYRAHYDVIVMYLGILSQGHNTITWRWKPHPLTWLRWSSTGVAGLSQSFELAVSSWFCGSSSIPHERVLAIKCKSHINARHTLAITNPWLVCKYQHRVCR